MDKQHQCQPFCDNPTTDDSEFQDIFIHKDKETQIYYFPIHSIADSHQLIYSLNLGSEPQTQFSIKNAFTISDVREECVKEVDKGNGNVEVKTKIKCLV